VGRIAAIVDQAYLSYYGEKVGYFGFFEAPDDREVAAALIERAKEILRGRGMRRMIGPMNPSTNYECGLLVEGFTTPPYIMMPHNPPYYGALLEGVGLRKAKDLYANMIIGDGTIPERLKRIVRKVRERMPALRVRPVNVRDFKGEIQRVLTIYHEAWGRNWGFVPMSEEEISFMAKKLKPLIVPDFALFAEIGEEAVGFVLALPNYNQVLKRLNGRIGPIGILKFLYYARRIDELRVLLLGVRPVYQRRGIETLLYFEVFDRGYRRGYKRGEMSWILEDNRLMQKGIEALGGRRYKTYRIYTTEL